MKKIFIFALLATAVTTATAQTTNQKTGTFTATGKNITVVYSLPASTGTATFILTNHSGAALKSGDHFSITLPSLAGYWYSLDNLQKNNNYGGTTVSSEMVINTDFVDGGMLSLQCPVVIGGVKPEKNPALTFIKK